MPTQTSYEHGTFSWVDLHTTPGVGRFSIVQDPQGAALALYKNAH